MFEHGLKSRRPHAKGSSHQGRATGLDLDLLKPECREDMNRALILHT